MSSKRLTATMRAALAEVEAEPGTPASELAGGRRTVLALMRRGLVERAPDSWRIYPAVCQSFGDHDFRSTMHMDGCHWYSTQGSCKCGAVIVLTGERNPREDPYSLVWMEPTGEDPCDRCEALRAGARPQHHTELIGPRKRLEVAAELAP